MLYLGIAAAVILMLVVVERHWRNNSNDLGYMSRQWLAEYNAQHP